MLDIANLSTSYGGQLVAIGNFFEKHENFWGFFFEKISSFWQSFDSQMAIFRSVRWPPS